ncbi:MAG: CRISPR-associated endonuclease Cas2 [Alphaproteobacteria bacterium]
MSNIIDGRKIMWMMVMFDLPTDTPENRHYAHKFREYLLDMGFSMNQYSVYTKFIGAKDLCPKYVSAIKQNAPTSGNITILFFTDKQFKDIILIGDLDYREVPKSPEQFMLF